jgi:salicylate hydroxylase
MGSIHPSKKFNIIIVGSGIAGLAAALGLHQKGHKVRILERNASIQTLGRPVNMTPSATRILTDYRLKNIIFDRLSPEDQNTYFSRFENGAQLGIVPRGAMEEAYGSVPYR